MEFYLKEKVYIRNLNRNAVTVDFGIIEKIYKTDQHHANPRYHVKLQNRRGFIISEANGLKLSSKRVNLKEKQSSTIKQPKPLFNDKILTLDEIIELLNLPKNIKASQLIEKNIIQRVEGGLRLYRMHIQAQELAKNLIVEEQPINPNEPLLTIEELAQINNCSVSFIKNLIPYYLKPVDSELPLFTNTAAQNAIKERILDIAHKARSSARRVQLEPFGFGRNAPVAMRYGNNIR